MFLTEAPWGKKPNKLSQNREKTKFFVLMNNDQKSRNNNSFGEKLYESFCRKRKLHFSYFCVDLQRLFLLLRLCRKTFYVPSVVSNYFITTLSEHFPQIKYFIAVYLVFYFFCCLCFVGGFTFASHHSDQVGVANWNAKCESEESHHFYFYSASWKPIEPQQTLFCHPENLNQSLGCILNYCSQIIWQLKNESQNKCSFRRVRFNLKCLTKFHSF